jgi:hypothetical protein
LGQVAVQARAEGGVVEVQQRLAAADVRHRVAGRRRLAPEPGLRAFGFQMHQVETLVPGGVVQDRRDAEQPV